MDPLAAQEAASEAAQQAADDAVAEYQQRLQQCELQAQTQQTAMLASGVDPQQVSLVVKGTFDACMNRP